MGISILRGLVGLKGIAKGLGPRGFAGILIGVVLLLWLLRIDGDAFERPYASVVFDCKGNLLASKIASDGQWRFQQTGPIADKFEKCLLTFEDQYFYYHPGINIVSVFEAFYKNTRSTKKQFGASTITMQLARLHRNNPKRTYWEKLVELGLALRMELSFSKKKILSYYVNIAPFGGNTVGLEAAAWRYFGRPPQSLSWAEAALLAVLPNSPTLMHLGKNRILLEKKRNRLLKELWTKKLIDQTTYELAVTEPIPERPEPFPALAPQLLLRICKEQGDGKSVNTTLNASIQRNCLDLLNNHIRASQGNDINNACVLVMETQTGNVLAYVGNSSVKVSDSENDVDMLAASRSSGSILKPLLFASLMNEGQITPFGLIEDIPTQIGSFAPKNFNLNFDGMVPANQAISRSLNVPAVKMLQLYGTGPFLFQLKKLGFTTIQQPAEHYGLSLILGGAEVSPWEVAGAYSSLGRMLSHYNTSGTYEEGLVAAPHYLKQKPIKGVATKKSWMNAACIWQMLQAMKEVARPQEYSTSATLRTMSDIAWKTGTSFGFRDAWAVGLNQQYTVVVWMGNADGEGRPGLTGITMAAPLLFSVFNTLPEKQSFKKPTLEMEDVKICSQSGFRASANCPNTKLVEMPKTCLASPVCPYHIVVQTDSTGKYRVTGSCYPVKWMKQKSIFMLNPIQEYFYRQSHSNFEDVPPLMEGCLEATNRLPFDIIYPRNGFRIYLPIDELGLREPLIVNATFRKKTGELFWTMDNAFIGRTKLFHQLSLHPGIGKHQIKITDEQGHTLGVNFEIVDKEKK